jgi:uncharacterized protein YdhG (YjbR/CyaY superfamily)
MSAPSPQVDAYIAALADDRRGPMTDLRETIRAAAPEAIEVITYKMPGFKAHGSFLVSYDAFKQHYSLFPWNDEMVEELGDEIEPYVKGRGTLQFPASKPLPLDLIRRIIEIRVRQSEPGTAD